MGNCLRVTISGGVGSGKTTVACLLARVLCDLGVIVTINDDDGEPSMMAKLQNQAAREAGLSGRSIVIKTVHEPKPSQSTEVQS